MSGKPHVAEVRGVAYKQNTDPYINPVVSAKLAEFPDGHLYLKKTADMDQMSSIEQKTKTGATLTKDDLAFLYEVDTKIQGFGLQPDSRISELRKGRDVNADMCTIFDCTPEQIAHTPVEITPDTKAYIGPLYPNIFQQLYHLDHIYTAFPEKKIRLTTIEIGGKNKVQLQAELQARKIEVAPWAKEIMDTAAFTTTPDVQAIRLVRLTIADLGFPNGCTTTQLFARRKELGLEFCPPATGPHYRLQYLDQPGNENVSIGMEPITDSELDPCVFRVKRLYGRLGLHASGARPTNHWGDDDEFVFRLSPSTTLRASKVETVAA